MKVLVIGKPGALAISALLAHRPDLQVVTDLAELEQIQDQLDDVIELKANPIWTPPVIKNTAPYYEHHRQRANRRKR